MTTPPAPCNLGDCVTVAIDPDGVTVGDTKTDGTLWFDHGEWAAFLAGVRAGQFDLPAATTTQDRAVTR